MKVLTLWEPWATLLVHGVKVFETRSWASSYEGPLLIHAAKRWTDEQKVLCLDRTFREAIAKALGMPPWWSGVDGTPAEHRGCIIGLVDLVGCREITPVSRQSIALQVGLGAYREARLGDWTDGRFAWQFSQMRTVLEPIPARGRQRLWNWDGDVATLRAQGASE